MKYTLQQYQTGVLNLLRIEKLMIEVALQKSVTKKEAAKRLGITYNSMKQRINKHNIKIN
jgi:transcriptional regulator with PAS, ATPase and Fis domain